MNEAQIKELQAKYGLSYHVSFANYAEQLIGLRGKRVLEVGGSLPRDFVIQELESARWLSLEEMDYWDETLSTGHVTGTPPPTGLVKKRFLTANPDELQEHNLYYGRIEDLPSSLEGHFDVVFSIAAFEHIARLPEALEKMYLALRTGGKLFSLFSPIWSAHDGHHLPAIEDKAGKVWSFGNSPIPPWFHLLMRPMELYDHLCGKCDNETARKIIYFVYQSPHINRFLLDDYFEIVARSSFAIEQMSPVFEATVPADIQQRLERFYPGSRGFAHNGLLMVLQRSLA